MCDRNCEDADGGLLTHRVVRRIRELLLDFCFVSDNLYRRVVLIDVGHKFGNTKGDVNQNNGRALLSKVVRPRFLCRI